MAVHRISDAAEMALEQIAKIEGRKPREILDDIIVSYWRGLDFDHPLHPSDDQAA